MFRLLAFSPSRLLAGIAIFLCTQVVYGQCPPNGEYTISSQQDIDDFVLNYPNCTSLDGLFFVGVQNPITNWAPLSQITHVDSLLGFFLQSSSMIGLPSFSTGPNFRIISQLLGPGMIDFQGLEFITSLPGGLTLVDGGNSQLTSLNGLQNVTLIGGGQANTFRTAALSIEDFPLLSNVNALENATILPLQGRTTAGGLFNNASLNNCAITSFCNGLAAGTFFFANGPGCASNSEVQAACNAPLPVDLISFKAQISDAHNILTWQTASEENASLFRIQRSIDAEKWEELNIIQAAGESSHLQSYSYLDKFAPEGVSYYSLVMEDLDGTQEYSEVVSVIRGQARPLEAFPNPTSGMLSLSGVPPDASVRVYGLLGKVVLEGTLQQGQLDLSGLPRGIYGVGVCDEVIKVVLE